MLVFFLKNLIECLLRIFKHLVVLTNKVQILPFLHIIKFNGTICLNLIGEYNVLYISFILMDVIGVT